MTDMWQFEIRTLYSVLLHDCTSISKISKYGQCAVGLFSCEPAHLIHSQPLQQLWQASPRQTETVIDGFIKWLALKINWNWRWVLFSEGGLWAGNSKPNMQCQWYRHTHSQMNCVLLTFCLHACHLDFCCIDGETIKNGPDLDLCLLLRMLSLSLSF